MSNSKNDKARSGKSGRSSASSLTDAVVAALAQVEAQGTKTEVEAQAPKAESKPPSEPAASAPEKVDAPNEPTESAPAASPKIAEASEPKITAADSVAISATVAVSEATSTASPPSSEPAATSAASTEPAAATPAPAPSVEAADSAKADAANAPRIIVEGPTDGSPTRPHAVAQVDKREGPTPKGLGVRYYGRTDVGLVREHNEDNLTIADLAAKRRGIEPAIVETTVRDEGLVFVVCDGMGGAAAGEVASQMAVDTVVEVMQAGGIPDDRDDFARRLVHAIEEAGSRIFAAAKMDRSRRGMGTTSTVAGLVDSTLFVGQVGDSRAYVLRGEQFALITKDQSLVNQLIEAGQLTEEEAEAFEHSNIILQALGTTEEVTVDLTFLELRRGDRLLLCSDGLSGLVHGDMMKEVLLGSPNLVDAAAQLISMANAGGGHDNITVVLVEFDGTDLRDPEPTARVAYQQYPLPPPPRDDEPKTSPRATHMKSGGPKPGADVKKSLPSPAPKSLRPRASGHADEGGGSPLIWIGLTAAIVLILMAVAWAISQSSGNPPPPAPVGAVRRPAAAPVAEAPASVRIETDLSGGELWVNGTRRGPLEAGMTLELVAGAYHLEARSGDARVSDATFTVAAGEHREVVLRTPTLPEAEVVAPTVELARSVLEGAEPHEAPSVAVTGAAVSAAATSAAVE